MPPAHRAAIDGDILNIKYLPKGIALFGSEEKKVMACGI
jgi:hypothetical protein